MDWQNRQAEIQNLVGGDPKLIGFWTSPPQVYISDVRLCQPPEKYAMIWLFIGSHAATLESIWAILSTTIRLIDAGSLFAGLMGMEIVPCIYKSDEPLPGQRVLRLSVHAKAIDNFLNLKPTALLQKTPIQNTGCFWYVDTDSMCDRK